MTFIDRPLPATLDLPRLVPRDKRLDNLRPGIGRAKGSQDKITRDLKQGLLEGAIAHGYDGEGEDGLIGYCHHIAERHPKLYCHLLAKLLPYNLNANVDGTAPSGGAMKVIQVGVIPADNYISGDQRELMAKDLFESGPPLFDGDDPDAA